MVIKPPYLSCIHHILDVGDGERRLGNIGGDHTQPTSFWGRLKHLRDRYFYCNIVKLYVSSPP